MLALAEARVANQGTGPLMFRFHRTARRISRRFGPEIASSWLAAATKFQGSIDMTALRSALVAGDLAQIEGAVGASGFAQMMKGLEDPLARTAGATGTASAQVLEEAGFPMQFNAVHPNVVLYARDQAAELVVGVTDDIREAIRTVVALGAQEGLTVVQQARAIREVVGLPPNWAAAPLHLGDAIRQGDVTGAVGRRLSAVDKMQIRSRIKRGTVTESFIEKMQEKYSKSLLNRRALNIARTESLRAAHAGQQESWIQAVQQKALPADSRRFWIVTPDERLSPEHAQIPGMNPDGVKMDESFNTPDGFFMFPPSRPNCRCGIGLGVGKGATAPEPLDVLEAGQAEQHLGRRFATQANLPAGKKQVVRDYQGIVGKEEVGGTNAEINRGLRLMGGTGGLSPANRLAVAELDDVIVNAPTIGARVTVWRGQEVRAPWQVGAVFKDAGFASTTTRRAIAENFAGDVLHNPTLVRMTLPANQRGVWMPSAIGDATEGEFLLPRNTHFRVVRYSQSKSPIFPEGIQIMDVEAFVP